MPITQQQLDEAYQALKSEYGGKPEDYFGLVYMEQELKLPRQEARRQVAFGDAPLGVHGWNFDQRARTLTIYQFQWSTIAASFKQSMRALVEGGLEALFSDKRDGLREDSFAHALRGKLEGMKNAVDKVFVYFMFNGDPEDADRSQVLERLREDLEGKKFYLDRFFGRPVTLTIQFRSAGKGAGTETRQRATHAYDVEIDETVVDDGPAGEIMYVGFVRLMDLYAIFKDMGPRFFERNIRYGLAEDASPNRAIAKALKDIIIDGNDSARVFAFNHNGVTIHAETAQRKANTFQLVEPRLLNGAQTITTLDRFVKKLEGQGAKTAKRAETLRDLHVLCRVITQTSPEFVVAVTINNNRQNPVMPWDLHANDMVQLELQDKFREELGIYYQRQDRAFANLSPEDLEELEISEQKAIEMLRLAQTYLASDGEIDKMSRMREVFESEKLYNEVFSAARLRADLRPLILCYKVQFRLRRLIREIMDRGENKYAYMARGRNLLWALLCQAILNDEKLDQQARRYGIGLTMEADFTEWLAQLSSTKARFLIRDVVSEEPYKTMMDNGRFDFFRTRAIFDKCMDMAKQRWGWSHKRLR